jgi:hypothetical protein
MATIPDGNSVPLQHTDDVPDRMRNAVEALARSQAVLDDSQQAVCSSRAVGVVGALAAAITGRNSDREELRAAVRSLAAELRGQKVPPEQLVITLIVVLRGATAPGAPERDIEALTRDVLLWGIDAYYAAA